MGFVVFGGGGVFLPFFFFLSVCQTHLHNFSTMHKNLIGDLFIYHITAYEPSTQMIMNQLGDSCFPFSLAKCIQLMVHLPDFSMTFYNNSPFYCIAVNLQSGYGIFCKLFCIVQVDTTISTCI